MKTIYFHTKDIPAIQHPDCICVSGQVIPDDIFIAPRRCFKRGHALYMCLDYMVCDADFTNKPLKEIFEHVMKLVLDYMRAQHLNVIYNVMIRNGHIAVSALQAE